MAWSGTLRVFSNTLGAEAVCKQPYDFRVCLGTSLRKEGCFDTLYGCLVCGGVHGRPGAAGATPPDP
eukprot:9781541-Alexandrium_andersonii.AAC.1